MEWSKVIWGVGVWLIYGGILRRTNGSPRAAWPSFPSAAFFDHAGHPLGPQFPQPLPALIMEVFCLGLSHQTADVATRERFAFAEHELAACCAELGRRPALGEAVILSTCNRVEIYAAAPDRAGRFSLGSRSSWPRAPRWSRARATNSSTASMAGRQFAASFPGRLRPGIDGPRRDGNSRPGQESLQPRRRVQEPPARHLNKLFQRAFNVAKEVRTKTNITRGPVSVGSVAVDLAEKISAGSPRAAS